MYYDILTYDPHLPRLGCCGSRRLTSATHRKGITVDDTTLRWPRAAATWCHVAAGGGLAARW